MPPVHDGPALLFLGLDFGLSCLMKLYPGICGVVSCTVSHVSATHSTCLVASLWSRITLSLCALREQLFIKISMKCQLSATLTVEDAVASPLLVIRVGKELTEL
jgi:hypothetical protein